MSSEARSVRHNQLRRLVGNRLKNIRAMFSLTQAELAELVGVSEKQISQIEQGISFPGLGLLGDVSVALNLPLDTFFNEITMIQTEQNWGKQESAFNALPPEAQKIVENLTWDLLRYINSSSKETRQGGSND